MRMHICAIVAVSLLASLQCYAAHADSRHRVLAEARVGYGWSDLTSDVSSVLSKTKAVSNSLTGGVDFLASQAKCWSIMISNLPDDVQRLINNQTCPKSSISSSLPAIIARIGTALSSKGITIPTNAACNALNILNQLTVECYPGKLLADIEKLVDMTKLTDKANALLDLVADVPQEPRFMSVTDEDPVVTAKKQLAILAAAQSLDGVCDSFTSIVKSLQKDGTGWLVGSFLGHSVRLAAKVFAADATFKFQKAKLQISAAQ